MRSSHPPDVRLSRGDTDATRSHTFLFPSVEEVTREDAVPALILIWSAREPGRIGESLLLAGPEGTTFLLGRGTAPVEGLLRLRPARMRPGRVEETPPFDAPHISRRQLELTPLSGGRILLNNVGRCRMFVNGLAVASGIAQGGDVIELESELAFYIGHRSPDLVTWPEEFPLPDFPFGGPGPGDAVGESPARWQLRRRIALVAPKDWQHVLVLGQVGSGKESTASLIHNGSPRGGRPLVVQQAGTLNSKLGSILLYGNLANAPVPGLPATEGLFASAHGTSFFLDESDQLPKETQSLLLRFMETGTYSRVGEAKERRADVRFILTTNRPVASLKFEVEARCGAIVSVPALEEGREDIVLITRAFILSFAATSAGARRFLKAVNGQMEPQLSPRAARLLTRRTYANNVRALLGVVAGWMDWSLLQGLSYVDAPPQADGSPKAAQESGELETPETVSVIPSISPSKVTESIENLDAILALYRRHGHNIRRMAASQDVPQSSPQSLIDQRRCLFVLALEGSGGSLRGALERFAGSPYDALAWKSDPSLRRLESALRRLVLDAEKDGSKSDTRCPGGTEAAREASRRLQAWAREGWIRNDLEDGGDAEPVGGEDG